MSYTSVFNIVNQILSKIGVQLDNEQEYDGIAIKKIAASNTLDKGKSGSQTHIAITGAQMDIFPYLRAEGYFNTRYKSKDDELKKYFSLRVPIHISRTNCDYLKTTDTQGCEAISDGSSSTILTYSHVIRSRREGALDQVQISLLERDHPDFLKFRKLIHSDDFMIMMKRKEKFEYEFYGVRAEDSILDDVSLLSMNNTFEKKSTITYVDATEIMSDEAVQKIEKDESLFGRNIIYYGAPGTGKSHNLDEKSKEFDFLERVTFYPEYTRDDFIGCFMPCMSYVKNDTEEYVALDGTITNLPGKPVPYYTYVPGPFTKALVDAFNNLDKNVLLIIEELNRANAAGVFGDFFQLLDRQDTGESKYAISVSNEYSEFLSSKISNYSKGEKLIIPGNFTICATMNSADQGVNPLDSAFKRRWSFKYVPINFTNVEHKDYEIAYGKGKITWEIFATTINEQLKKKEINEDKYLGQYFITKKEIVDIDMFASKLLLYLFDDVLKFNRRGFFKSNYKTFSDLLTGFINGEKIFEFEFTSQVIKENNSKGDEAALDYVLGNKVSESQGVNYSEQPKNEDMPRVAEGGSNVYQDKVL